MRFLLAQSAQLGEGNTKISTILPKLRSRDQFIFKKRPTGDFKPKQPVQ
jgi:hypothetical protein